MAKILEFWHPDGNKYLRISEGVHLGRNSELEWATNRQPPPEFSKLELAIQLEGHPSLSRNHAAILPEVDGQNFSLVDLNSDTGTYRNGTRVPAGEHVILQLNDLIVLGNPDGYKLVVSGIKNDDTNHHAILAGYSYNNPKGTAASLEVLAEKLQKRGFDRKNLTILYGDNANSENIARAIGRLVPLATKGSHTLFYFYQHGNENGIALPDGLLSPEELYQALKRVRGKHAVIIDACNAGIFANERILPPDTLAVTASRSNQDAFSDSLARGEPYIGNLTRALLTYLNKNPGKFDLGQVGEYLQGVVGVLAAARGVMHTPVVRHGKRNILTGWDYTMPPETTLEPLWHRPDES